jgi:DNA-binding NarL/FixJ family response regulator
VTIKVLLAEDHVIVRDGLRTLIDDAPGMRVVAEAADGGSVVSLAKELKPDVIIMDVGLNGLNGVEATRQVTAEAPRVKVIALSMHSDRRYVAGMLKAGASGYLLKDCAFDEMTRAIRSVASGGSFLGSGIAEMMAVEYTHRGHASSSDTAFSQLTNREREVLQLLAEGRSTRETASMLGVSIKTIETHRQQIMRKLKIHSIAELTKYAVREGLTSLDP